LDPIDNLDFMADNLAQLVDLARPRFRTATEFVEATLKQAILNGTLPGGSPLRQEELASTFGVSRMPIREALRQLEAQALVDFYPHRGAVVSEISAQDAADNYTIRLALEPVALRLSIPKLSGADLDRADEILSEMDGEPDQSRLGALNRRFHMTLYARADRPRLLSLVEQHLVQADRYLRFHLAAMGRHHISQEEHRALVEAARERKPALACRILVAHIGTAERTLQYFLDDRKA
jgi:DNA-binding GntR family transcriptional regulator